jgi:hypothetical protein
MLVLAGVKKMLSPLSKESIKCEMLNSNPLVKSNNEEMPFDEHLGSNVKAVLLLIAAYASEGAVSQYIAAEKRYDGILDDLKNMCAQDVQQDLFEAFQSAQVRSRLQEAIGVIEE